ncbi:NifU family protein [Micromonospora olivasterospora]|uniref:Fe-S cluster biogenesis protein NfuA n=1 Tax=Micromonospora olivasterospora TaxID=1880 RepID=A0A562I8A2_MICOL|nr:NifU family protein [Micromonospora olivasterospora]TWH67231.1 Fe-S cluster biogenesis protein NfuA [Micromonospora olivasterospora]
MIPIHPQPVADHPEQLRWITPAGVLPFTGVAAALPAPLAALREDGTLAKVRVDPTAIVTTLHPGRQWSRDGARVRTALHTALADPSGWTPADVRGEPDDGPLRVAAQELLDGPVGDLARSHGGHIELVDVRDGTVTVTLAGACHGCPAARTTLRQGLEDRLRRSHPQLRAVTADPHRR